MSLRAPLAAPSGDRKPLVLLVIIGIMLCLVGVITFIWGDKPVFRSDGWLLRTMSWARGRERLMKWLAGLGLIYAGIEVLMRALK
jgi:threonine/homoserine/homoserine lactone efflux protein